MDIRIRFVSLARVLVMPVLEASLCVSGALAYDDWPAGAVGIVAGASLEEMTPADSDTSENTAPATGPPEAEESARQLLFQLQAATTPRRLYLTRKRAADLTDRFTSCVMCRRVHARALERAGMGDEAARQWRRLLKLRADDTEALLALADYHVAEGLRYRTMVSGPISLAEFGYEDLEHGVEYLARLRKIHGGKGAAEMRLAELALTLGKWSEAIQYATSAAMFSNEGNAHAILGAALLRLGDPEEAAREFAVFLDACDDSVRALYNDPSFFFARRGLDLRKIDQPADTGISSWDERDPRLLTPENERLLEHYTRVTIAAVRCGSKPGAWDGMRSEPGVLLVRFGEPVDETRIRPEIGDDGGLRFEELRYYYPEYTIVMDDQSLMGRFHLAGGGRGDSLSYVEGVRLIKRIKERFDPHGGEPALAMTTRSWVLPRRDKGLAVTAVDIPAGDLELHWDGQSAPFARFAIATVWRSQETGIATRSAERFEADRIRGCTSAPGFSAAVMETLTAGTWQSSLEVEDRSTGRWSRRDTTLIVADVAMQPGLSLVGPIPCWGATGQATAGMPLEAGSLVPTSRPVYGAQDTLIMYFEVHALAPDRWGFHRGSITHAVGRVDERPWWRRVLGGGVGPGVSVEVKAQGRGDSILSNFEIRLPPVVAGVYEYLLRCVDNVSERSAEDRCTFRVCGEHNR